MSGILAPEKPKRRSALKKITPEEAITYREAMRVTKSKSLGYHGLYPVCPRCNQTLEREYQAYCDRCGQCLNWRDYGR